MKVTQHHKRQVNNLVFYTQSASVEKKQLSLLAFAACRILSAVSLLKSYIKAITK